MYIKYVVHETVLSETEKRLGCALFLLLPVSISLLEGMPFGKIMYVASSRKRNFNPLIHCAGDIFACQVGSMTGNAM